MFYNFDKGQKLFTVTQVPVKSRQIESVQSPSTFGLAEKRIVEAKCLSGNYGLMEAVIAVKFLDSSKHLPFEVKGEAKIENEKVLYWDSGWVEACGRSWSTESVNDFSAFRLLDAEGFEVGRPRGTAAGTGGGSWEEQTEFHCQGSPKFLHHSWRHDDGFNRISSGEKLYVIAE